MAKLFLEKAIQLDPNCVQAMDLLATEVLPYMGGDSTEEVCARLLDRAIELDPLGGGGMRQFHLGQVVGGKRALEYYQAALELVKSATASSTNTRSASSIAIHAAAAEVFMTDLCDEEGAMDSCKAHVEAALSESLKEGCAVEGKFDALGLSATFNKIIGEIENSREDCQKCLHLVMDSSATNTTIRFDSKLSLARTLVDLELVEDATLLLTRLLDEEDEDSVEVS